MNIYSRLELVKGKIEHCKRFLDGIESGEHPAFFKPETERDLRYWQAELVKLVK